MFKELYFDNMTIAKAWDKLRETDNKISLLETLRETESGRSPKSYTLKEILSSSGRINNNILLNAILKSDKYTEELQNLYKEKNAYEKYILDEIDRQKIFNPGIAIGFLKEYLKMTWIEISDTMDYSQAQVRRYYDEYKGKTPKNNTFFKDEQK